MTAPAFDVAEGALQWLVIGPAMAGRMTVAAPGRTRAVVDTGYGTSTGSVSLQVQAEGPWHMRVEQQVDVPLDEPPPAGMSAPDAMRVFVTANSELDVRLSSLDEPKTSPDQFLGAPSAVVAHLGVTTGSLNFTVPTEVDPTQYRPVVIWCRLINGAPAGATLRPVQ